MKFVLGRILIYLLPCFNSALKLTFPRDIEGLAHGNIANIRDRLWIHEVDCQDPDPRHVQSRYSIPVVMNNGFIVCKFE